MLGAATWTAKRSGVGEQRSGGGSMSKQRPVTKPERFFYVAKRRDGTYRGVEAMNWQAARRYFGSAAVSIRKCEVTFEELFRHNFDFSFARQLYERAGGDVTSEVDGVGGDPKGEEGPRRGSGGAGDADSG
jgi:hypothetical protein